ncbi:MAG: stalk domain-containing protein, partial [Syntrophomonadaceae bacterium]|nr:stalk domain-containing protein [Syntrophomonadaceae bacterium]
ITESSDEAGKSINALFVTLLTVTDAAIAIPSIDGITVPVKGETPDTTADETAEYTASITWIGNPTVFAASTAYSAEITITPKTGYTLTGVTENFFTVAGAAATNPADSGVVTAVFPITGPDVPQLINAKTSKTGDIVTLEFDKAMADPSADAGSFAVKVHGNQGSYYSDTPKLWTITPSTAAINADPAKVDLLLGESIQRGDVVTVDYTPGTVAAADSTSLGAIKNFPVTNNIPIVIESNLKGTWQAFDHVGNWNEVDFPNGGDDPRGKAFNRHIVINGSEVIFYGNGVHPFKDFLYMPNSETTAKSFTFDLDLSGINYHSMEGGGFLFNTEIDGGLLYGYCALFTIDQSYSLYSRGQNYAVNLYQIDGVDVKNFNKGDGFNLINEPKGIKKLGSYPLPDSGYIHSIMLEASSNTVDLWDGSSKIIDSSNANLPKVYGNGVGIIASYFSHDCSKLSWFKFSDLKIQGIADLAAELHGDHANLTFTAPAGATSVIVQQSTDGAIFTDSAILNPPIGETDTTATVTGLAKKQSYYFRLLIAGGKYDGYSRIATAAYTGLINDLRATSGDSQAYLTFSAPEEAEGVAVMQSTDGGINFTPAAITGEVTALSTSATVTGLTNGQEYQFKLVITGGVHAGDSNIAATTPNVKQDSSRSGGSSQKVEKVINKLRFEIGDTDCYLTSGSAIEKVIPMDAAPIRYEDRTLLPIRYVVEPLGGTARWNQA